jgi:hypothetical protein
LIGACRLPIPSSYPGSTFIFGFLCRRFLGGAGGDGVIGGGGSGVSGGGGVIEGDGAMELWGKKLLAAFPWLSPPAPWHAEFFRCPDSPFAPASSLQSPQ